MVDLAAEVSDFLGFIFVEDLFDSRASRCAICGDLLHSGVEGRFSL
jgi:hypothetical protein